MDGRVEYALDGGVFTAGALLEWLSRDLGLAADPPGARRARLRGRGQRRRAGAAGARRPRRAVVAAGRHAPSSPGSPEGRAPGHVARAALESIAWRVADILAVVAEHAEPETLRVDGGLTRDPLLLRLQADATGVPVEQGAIDATAAGAAALAAVGAGVWSSTREIGERVPTGRADRARSATTNGAQREHAAWREFVERAAEL